MSFRSPGGRGVDLSPYATLPVCSRTGGLPVERRSFMSAQSSGVCDVCGAGLSAPSGHLLVTREVVREPKYWEHYYRKHEAEFALLGVRSYEAFKNNPDLREMCAKTLAGQSTPWMVCESCVDMFGVDRQAAHRYAEQWWQSGGTFAPPGVGRAPLSAVNMDEAPPTSPRPPPGKEGFLDRLMRPQRVKRMWEQAKKIGTDAQTTQAICSELLGMVDESSKEPDLGRVFIVRGNSYLGQDRYEEALADYSRAADMFLRRKDLSGILDCERRMRFLHISRIPKGASPGSEKAERLQHVHFASALMRIEWTYSSATQLEDLLSHLGDPDPDVRAFACHRLGDAPLIAPEGKKWLVDYYRKCLLAEDDRAALVGRRVGDFLFMGPDDVYPGDIVWMKLGRDVANSFVNCTCAHCGYPNRGIPVPLAGVTTPYFSRKDRHGEYSVLVLCVRCSREFFIAWDTDPRH